MIITLSRFIPKIIKDWIRLPIMTLIYGLTFRKGWRDLALSSLSAMLKLDRASGKPVSITIEPTNICNQECPVCETGARILRRPKYQMPLRQFRIIIDKIYKHTNSIMLYFMGEPFLNKDIKEMIEYAISKSIYVATCTNGQFVIPEAVIKSGISEISFQIGGVTQETHKKYRISGDLKRTLDNLIKTVEIKKKYPQSKTKIILGFIVMKHNEHEIDAVKKLANEIGVDRLDIISPCVRTIEQGRDFLPKNDNYWIYNRKAFNEGLLIPKNVPNNRCDWLYYSVTIQCNGDIVPCCRDTQGDYVLGNIFQEDFSKIWNNKKYRMLRRMVKTNQKQLQLCQLCSSYGIPKLY